LNELKKIAQNYLKYEEGFEFLVSKSRKYNNNKYCLSNKYNFKDLTNEEIHNKILYANSLKSLIEIVWKRKIC
jgi:hypothetical protein